MAKKLYYVYRLHSGAFGACGWGERLPRRYSNKKAAEIAKRQADKAVRRAGWGNRCIHWVDWEWVKENRCATGTGNSGDVKNP